MKIEFYNKDTGRILTGTDDVFFVMNNEVYCDNGQGCESQSAYVQFEDFIERDIYVGWRVIE